MKNKFIAGLLSLAIFCTLNVCVVKANEFSSAGPQNVPVTCTIDPTFTVRLPATIPLIKNGSDYKYVGNIGVKGDIQSGYAIGVATSNTVKIYDMTLRTSEPLPTGDEEATESHRASVAATVTLDKQSWTNADNLNASTYKEQALIVNAGALGSATWKGNMLFNISYGPVAP